ncbi:hypothetical protein FA13DRAFT_382153 [Coprinellus micaceus]|uniref:Uncharacterized protein n=1 Tax=Coprinellus micaceus TaxID=71717 RepID=A0A4Y7SE87_COPMI|nr:hypothetical protein FA13DRAFT_382153 [Coprinellus micaceus]
MYLSFVVTNGGRISGGASKGRYDTRRLRRPSDNRALSPGAFLSLNLRLLRFTVAPTCTSLVSLSLVSPWSSAFGHYSLRCRP